MKLVIGGAFQGKYYYARKTFDIQEGWVDGSTCGWDNIFQARGIRHFHDYIRRRLEADMDLEGLPQELLERNPQVCILTNEVGYGVVPVEAFDRKYREMVGRVCEQLAARSEEVHRVVCGIGMVIKHA